MQSWFAKFLRKTGSYHLAEIIYQWLKVQFEKVLGLQHPDTLTNMGNIALTFTNQSQWKEAEELKVHVGITTVVLPLLTMHMLYDVRCGTVV